MLHHDNASAYYLMADTNYREESIFGSLVQYAYDLISEATNRLSIVTLYSYLIMSSSLFIYITIYQTYIPIVRQSNPVHLQFASTCKDNCTNPFAIVEPSYHLTRGQSYRILLALDVPESDINWDQGVFMVRLKLFDSSGRVTHDSSRPAMLKFKTLITRILSALAYSPLILFNYRSETQKINIQLIDNYVETSRFSKALLEIQARDIQIYSANLHVIANLSGLTYYMYQWPISSAIIGVFTIASFMALLSINWETGVLYRETEVPSSDEEDSE